MYKKTKMFFAATLLCSAAVLTFIAPSIQSPAVSKADLASSETTFSPMTHGTGTY